MIANKLTIHIDLRNEHGVALLLTIILMLLLSLLTVSLYELLQASTQITGNHRLELRAVYVADAGVEDAVNALRDTPDVNPEFTAEAFGGGTYTVSVTDWPPSSPSIYAEKDIVSTGAISDFQRRLEVHVKIIEIGGPGTGSYAVATTSWKLMPLPPS